MAKKKKAINPRAANWSQLKSILWQEQKERGVYKYNSKNFNTLVSDVYNTLGKKVPKNNRTIITAAEKAEYDLFTAPSPEPEQIEYFNIDRALQSYQNNSFYSAFTVVTNFAGNFPDVEIPLADYEYQGSTFQGIIEAADKMRRDKGMNKTPEKKIMIEVDHKNQTIMIYVAGAPPSGTGKSDKGYKNIAKTPEAIEKNVKKKNTAQTSLDKIEKRIEDNEAILIRLASLGDKAFKKAADPILNSMKDLQDKKSKLTNEIREADKYLTDTEGFGKTKKVNKKRTKAKSKGTGSKRKRK